MKIKLIVLALLLVLIISLGGCLKQDYSITIIGFYTVPEIVDVNQAFSIYLSFVENNTPSLVKEFNWKVDDFANEFVTPSAALHSIKFTTPGEKNVVVRVTANDKNFKANEFPFVVKVQ